MSFNARALALGRLDESALYQSGEAALVPTLVRWLVASGRLRARTHIAYELPWLGRRVDVATVTSRGVTTAFELKIGSLQRALEQAAYNSSAFHRSWVVTANRPRAEGMGWARELGVGIALAQGETITPLVAPMERAPHPTVARRLRASILTRSKAIT